VQGNGKWQQPRLLNSPVTKSVSDQFVSGAMTMTRIAVSASNWAIIAMANAALV
jgi:hypothetical protein